MRLMKLLLVVIFTWILFTSGVAAEDTLEKQLNDQYHDRVLALRRSFKSNSQEYAADGSPVKTSEEGAWALYGRILVTNIKVDGKQLTLKGTRALYIFNNSGIAAQFPDDRKHPAETLMVTVHLQEPLSSVDDADVVLGHIFALTREDILNTTPVYWRSHLTQHMGIWAVKIDASKAADINQSHEKTAASNHGPFFRLSDPGVKPPQIIHKEEPPYTETARNRQLQGVVGLNLVVDPTGKVGNINIVRPLGMGLDESAVATVSTWRFAPATKDGQPVAVPVYVEFSFRLY